MKKEMARPWAEEIAAAAKRHERRHGATVRRQISAMEKRCSEEVSSVVSFLVRHPPMASLTQATRDALKRRLDEGCKGSFALCHYVKPLGVELPDEYPLMAIAWSVLVLMADHNDRRTAGSKNLVTHFRGHKFGPRESRALASMLGLSAINSVLQCLRTRNATRSAEVLIKTLPVVFGGMAAGLAARAAKKSSAAKDRDRKRLVAVHLLPDRIFALACPPEIGECFLEVSSLFYEWAMFSSAGELKEGKGLNRLRDRLDGWSAEFQDAVAWRVKQVMDGKTKIL